MRLLTLALPALAAGPRDASETKIALHRNWEIQSSCQVKAGGKEISSVGFSGPRLAPRRSAHNGRRGAGRGRHVSRPLFRNEPEIIPGNGLFRQVLRQSVHAGGQSVPLLVVVPDRIPALPAQCANATTWLHFDGINYRANVWLNGEKIADAQDIAGMMRAFRIRCQQASRRRKSQRFGGRSLCARQRTI